MLKDNQGPYKLSNFTKKIGKIHYNHTLSTTLRIAIVGLKCKNKVPDLMLSML